MNKISIACATALALSLLVGCVPGEAEFTFRTSEVRKALRGEVAHVRVHETMTTVLSNASESVTFGNGRFTNRLDVVKALAARVGGGCPFDFMKDDWTNDVIRVWVEESTNALPCVKMDAQLNVTLGTEGALARHVRENQLQDLCAFMINPATGSIEEVKGAEFGKALPPSRMAMFMSAVFARLDLLETLFGKDDDDLAAVDQSLMSVMTPTWFDDLSCVIIGDGEPLYVVAEDVKVNGKPMPRFEGWVRQGERLHLAQTKKHEFDVRFFLKSPEQ